MTSFELLEYLRALGLPFKDWDAGFMVWGLGLGFEGWGLGFGV